MSERAQTIAGNAEGNPSAEKGTSMDKSIGDGPTMRPKEERIGCGAFAPGDVIASRRKSAPSILRRRRKSSTNSS